MNCAAEMRDFTQITDWKTGVDPGNITPAKRLETMTGLAGNFDRREHIGIVFQDYVKYHLSLGQNIGIGNIDSFPDETAIERAASMAGIDIQGSRFPDGQKTILGKRFKGGVELSIGEWQKVALARAFVRDASLMILDEPSSALDAKAEQQLF